MAFPVPAKTPPAQPQRTKGGQFAKGHSGHPGGDGGRARRALNSAFLGEMLAAFNRGGRKAIDKVMLQQPAIFVKMLTLLVPREMEITRTDVVKQMSDQQIEDAIAAIEAMLAARDAGASAKVIEHQAQQLPAPRRAVKRRRKVVKAEIAEVGADMVWTQPDTKAVSD